MARARKFYVQCVPRGQSEDAGWKTKSITIVQSYFTLGIQVDSSFELVHTGDERTEENERQMAGDTIGTCAMDVVAMIKRTIRQK
jgi:hypothetical protein